ncbi:MAG: class I SAM-dependent methyltransferase [bacterium]|jgi:SAM-dependent methyltransferase|nr:class I SAM-dependent methyltransferase [bacterium]
MPENPSTPRRQSHNQQTVVEFFRWHVRVYGNDWRALGWQSRYTQFRRFAVLAEIGSLAHRRVLDVGCGLGDLYDYLEAEKIPVDYTGYDLLPDMVKRARKRFPQVHFEVYDILQGLGEERFDYILSSGAFNVNFGDNLSAVQQVIREMITHSTYGVAINFLKRYPGASNDPIFQYYEPQEMLTFCQMVCQHARLRKGYLPNDFTLYLYP